MGAFKSTGLHPLSGWQGSPEAIMWKETVFWFGLVPHLVVPEMELGMWSLCLVLESEPSLGPNRYRGPCLP